MLGYEGGWNSATAVGKRPWPTDYSSAGFCSPSCVVRASGERAVGFNDWDGNSRCPVKRRRNGINSVCNAFNKRMKTQHRDSELSPEISSPGSDSFLDGVDVPISLHPHTEQLYQQFFPGNNTADNRILQVFPPKIDLIRQAFCLNEEKEAAKTRSLGDNVEPAGLGGMNWVLLGESQVEFTADTDDDDQWCQLFDVDACGGENTPIKMVPSFAAVRPPSDQREAEKCPVVPLISVRVRKGGGNLFTPPPPVFQTPAPSVTNTSKERKKSTIHLDFKPYRMLGTVGITDETKKTSGQVRNDIENRILVPIDRDPARTNGAMALTSVPSSTRDIVSASRTEAGSRSKVLIVKVDTVPLVVRGMDPSVRRPHQRVPLWQESLAYGGSDPNTPGRPARRAGINTEAVEEDWGGYSSQNTITDNGLESGDTISNNDRAGAQTCWEDAVFKDCVTQVDVRSISEPLTSYLVRLDVSLNAAIKSLAVSRILLLLDHLVALPLRFVHLKGSGICGTVMRLRKHCHPEVVKSARALVRRWRWTVQQQWQISQPLNSRIAESCAMNSLEMLIRRLERVLGDLDELVC